MRCYELRHHNTTCGFCCCSHIDGPSHCSIAILNQIVAEMSNCLWTRQCIAIAASPIVGMSNSQFQFSPHVFSQLLASSRTLGISGGFYSYMLKGMGTTINSHTFAIPLSHQIIGCIEGSFSFFRIHLDYWYAARYAWWSQRLYSFWKTKINEWLRQYGMCLWGWWQRGGGVMPSNVSVFWLLG